MKTEEGEDSEGHKKELTKLRTTAMAPRPRKMVGGSVELQTVDGSEHPMAILQLGKGP
jgi:hypothetical protein